MPDSLTECGHYIIIFVVRQVEQLSAFQVALRHGSSLHYETYGDRVTCYSGGLARLKEERVNEVEEY